MRVKRGVIHKKHKQGILKYTKGFRWRRKSSIKLARTAGTHALKNAYEHRRLKKRDFRTLWNVRINAGARQHGISYSKFIAMLKAKKIELNRKMLSELAAQHPDVFTEIIKLSQGK